MTGYGQLATAKMALERMFAIIYRIFSWRFLYARKTANRKCPLWTQEVASNAERTDRTGIDISTERRRLVCSQTSLRRATRKAIKSSRFNGVIRKPKPQQRPSGSVPGLRTLYAEGFKESGGVVKSRSVGKISWVCSKTKTIDINFFLTNSFFFSTERPLIFGTRLLWRSGALCSRPIARSYSRAKCRCRSSVTGRSDRFRRCPRKNSVSTRNWCRPACRVRLLRGSCPRWSENQHKHGEPGLGNHSFLNVLTNIRDKFTTVFGINIEIENKS